METASYDRASHLAAFLYERVKGPIFRVSGTLVTNHAPAHVFVRVFCVRCR